MRSNFTDAFFLHLSQRQLIQVKNELEFIDDNGPFSWEKSSFMKYHTIWKLLYWFSELLDEQLKAVNTNVKNKYELQIINILEYLHKHFNEKIIVDDLCKKSYLSRSTFLRSFKAVCGMSPIKYLNNIRCRRALELLEKSEYSKTDIAHECSFYDLSHMERMLKRYCQHSG